MKYFRIKNWDKYQSDPVKKKNGRSRFNEFYIHTDILDDPKTYNMTALQFMVWIKLLAIARQLGNKIPLDRRWLAVRTGTNRAKARLNLDYLWDLGLIEAESLTGEERRGECRRGEESGVFEKPKTTVKEHPLFKIWNENRKNLKKCISMQESRQRKWRRCLKTNPDINYWIDIIQRIAESPFCNGENDRGWVADIDFFLKPDTHVKVLEGKYDSNKTKKSGYSAAHVIRSAKKNVG